MHCLTCVNNPLEVVSVYHPLVQVVSKLGAVMKTTFCTLHAEKMSKERSDRAHHSNVAGRRERIAVMLEVY